MPVADSTELTLENPTSETSSSEGEVDTSTTTNTTTTSLRDEVSEQATRYRFLPQALGDIQRDSFRRWAFGSVAVVSAVVAGIISYRNRKPATFQDRVRARFKRK